MSYVREIRIDGIFFFCPTEFLVIRSTNLHNSTAHPRQRPPLPSSPPHPGRSCVPPGSSSPCAVQRQRSDRCRCGQIPAVGFYPYFGRVRGEGFTLTLVTYGVRVLPLSPWVFILAYGCNILFSLFFFYFHISYIIFKNALTSNASWNSPSTSWIWSWYTAINVINSAKSTVPEPRSAKSVIII